MRVRRSFAIGGNMVTLICDEIRGMRNVHGSRVDTLYPVDR